MLAMEFSPLTDFVFEACQNAVWSKIDITMITINRKLWNWWKPILRGLDLLVWRYHVYVRVRKLT